MLRENGRNAVLRCVLEAQQEHKRRPTVTMHKTRREQHVQPQEVGAETRDDTFKETDRDDWVYTQPSLTTGGAYRTL